MIIAFSLVTASPISKTYAAQKPNRTIIERLNASFEKARRNREARKKIREQRKLEEKNVPTQNSHNLKHIHSLHLKLALTALILVCITLSIRNYHV